jgi:hypothetical protein
VSSIAVAAATGLAAIVLTAFGLARWDRGEQVSFWSKQGANWPILARMGWGALIVLSAVAISQAVEGKPFATLLGALVVWGGVLLLGLWVVVSWHNRAAADPR